VFDLTNSSAVSPEIPSIAKVALANSALSTFVFVAHSSKSSASISA
jgi:hypothetical protein